MMSSLKRKLFHSGSWRSDVHLPTEIFSVAFSLAVSMKRIESFCLLKEKALMFGIFQDLTLLDYKGISM